MTEAQFKERLVEEVVKRGQVQHGYVSMLNIPTYELANVADTMWDALAGSAQDLPAGVGEGQHRLITETLVKWSDRLQSKQELAEKIVEILKA